MSYITLDQAKDYLGDLYESAYDDNGTPNDALLTEDIDSVTATIDAYVKKQYDFTIVGVQSLAMLKSYSERLLKSKAYERYDSSRVPEAVENMYIDTIMRLKDLASGKLLLPDSVQEPKANLFCSNMTANTSNSSYKGTIFTRDKMRGV
jgi:phage gp36-like protein